MNILPQTTRRRLQKIQQIPSVWEGDRRSLSGLKSTLDPNSEGNGECIIWVDGSEGFVRAMDVVSPEMGPEAIVRTLLRAIETPHSPAKPARPQKIVVRSRETQFFLRGALQNLDITIDYVPELPLIDELFRGFEEMNNARPPAIPAAYEPLLRQSAYEIWQAQPWNVLADHDILAIELNSCGIETLYACIMGMLGREYGIILYRSLESLKQFRIAAIEEKSANRLEKAFLSQDCWFLNFESIFDLDDDEDEDEDEDDDFDLADLPTSEIRPLFGSVHPYEGIRPFLDEEESIAIYLGLQAILQFFECHESDLDEETISEIKNTFEVPLPAEDKTEQLISITVSTLPQLSSELIEMIEDSEDDEDNDKLQVPLQDDLVPENSFLSLGMVPWDLIEDIQDRSKIYYQSKEISPKGDGLPVIMIQTSRPKAKELINKILDCGGLESVCFNPGEDPFSGNHYDLGILQMVDGSLYLFGEFLADDPEHIQARRKWENRCQKTQGYCGLIVAMGVTGSSRGNPQLNDMMALFETKAVDSKELAMGVLQLMPQFDF
ncbi:DUF6930 domain-containing protein [Gloeothece verrucosa]|uniref:Uncharacterized protein n=1 Tax=Gloeothece verrucosa (strain PCC 7822) TaxID=497965 RepID=E0U5Z7_GLOV7|nr:hypothetical protein [Gloeothece verrucosa]ADN17106.1 conserved hypothetical protein [Gloeothece verrucosa PCC 7822]